MPKLHDCLLLARSMREETKLPDYIRFYVDNSEDSSLSSLGYFGKVFIDDVNREILFVHRSTTIDGFVQKHETSFFVASSNLASDTSIYVQALPPETKTALAFVKKTHIELSASHPDYTCVQIGHSLGGFHAHICGYVLKHRVIAFDPPGAKEILLQHYFPLDMAQCEQHHSFFIVRNLINETNHHVGKLAYGSYREQWQEDSSIQTTAMTLETHSLDLFFKKIPNDSQDSLLVLPEGFVWQQVILAAPSALFHFSQASQNSTTLISEEREETSTTYNQADKIESTCLIV